MHWEALYAEVSLEWQLGVASRHMGPKHGERYDLDVRLVRATLCTLLGIPEELMLPERISDFYKTREKYARLPLQYPGARVVENMMAGFQSGERSPLLVNGPLRRRRRPDSDKNL